MLKIYLKNILTVLNNGEAYYEDKLKINSNDDVIIYCPTAYFEVISMAVGLSI